MIQAITAVQTEMEEKQMTPGEMTIKPTSPWGLRNRCWA